MKQRPEVEIIVGKVVPWPEDGSRKFSRANPPEPIMFAHCPDVDSLPVREANAVNDIINSLEEATGGGILGGWPDEADYLHVWRVYVRFTLATWRRIGNFHTKEWRNFKACNAEGAAELRGFATRLRDAFRARAEVAQ